MQREQLQNPPAGWLVGLGGQASHHGRSLLLTCCSAAATPTAWCLQKWNNAAETCKHFPK